MNSYKYLLKNIGLFTLGEFASKFITFFMLPLYTYYLSTEEYALIDLIQVTQSLIIPIITLSIVDAVLCYSFDQNENKSEVFTIGLTVTLVAIVLTWAGCFIVRGNGTIAPYWILIAVSMTSQMGNNLLSNFARAVDKVSAIAASSIFATLLVAGSNILMVAYLGMGIHGYLLALVAGNVFRCVYLGAACKIWREISFGSMHGKTIWKMLKYSLPMIPNSLFWWVNSSINKYFLTGMTSLSEVGLYSAASKIPTLGNTVMNVFNSAWRLSAIKEDSSEDKSSFFLSIYELFSLLLIIVTLGITVCVKPLALILFSKDFYQAWIVVPLLMIGFYFNSMNSFVGSLFVGAKITKILFTTTVFGAVANVVFNLILIPQFGIMGAAVATIVSNAAVFVARLVRAKQWLGFETSWAKLALAVISAVILAVVACMDTLWLYVVFVPAFGFVLFLYREQLKFMVNTARTIIDRVKGK